MGQDISEANVKNFDVVVIGAGISGISAANRLA